MAEKVSLTEAELILRDKNRGMSPGRICEKWGISLATLYRRLQQARDANPIEDLVAFRKDELAACDDLIERWQEQLTIAAEMSRLASSKTREVNGVQVPAPSMDGIDRAAKIREGALNGMAKVRERRAKLAGADAPVKGEVTVTHVTPTDTAIQDLLSQFETKKAVSVAAQ